MRVAMIGATGLIGRALAPRIAASHDLLLIGRRAAGVKGAEERIAPIAEWQGLLAGETIDVAISTLGTTIRRQDARLAELHATLDWIKQRLLNR